jgi:hypothetical protein
MKYNFENRDQSIELDIRFDVSKSRLTVGRIQPGTDEIVVLADKKGEKHTVLPILTAVLTELGAPSDVAAQMGKEVFERMIADNLL